MSWTLDTNQRIWSCWIEALLETLKIICNALKTQLSSIWLNIFHSCDAMNFKRCMHSFITQRNTEINRN